MLPLCRPQWMKVAAIPVAASARPATNRHDPVLGFNISTDGAVAPAMPLDQCLQTKDSPYRLKGAEPESLSYDRLWGRAVDGRQVTP